jgi:hypothetical protein
MSSIDILKRKTKETKKLLDRIDIDRSHIHDKLHQLKQCSHDHPSKKTSAKKTKVYFNI